jgi:hypothetical protein
MLPAKNKSNCCTYIIHKRFGSVVGTEVLAEAWSC